MSSFNTERFSALLATQSLGRTLHYFWSADSTNTRLKELAGLGAPEGCLVVADQQSSGRGRWGRNWESADGKGLLFSFLLRPGKGPLGQLPIVLGLACADTLEGCRLKWPNDLFCGGKKLGGMLLEGGPGDLVAGIGINVNQGRDDFPESLRDSATSLRIQHGHDVDREATLAAILLRCEARLAQWRAEGFAQLKRDWHEKALFMGENVQAGELKGRALGLDDDGSLEIETAGGVKKLHSGELFRLRPILD